MSRLPSDTRPSTLFAENVVVLAISDPTPVPLVAAAQEEADDDEARQKRGAALTDEGKRETGQGDEAGYAADDDEGLQHDDGGEACRDERADVGFRTGGGEDAADSEA